MTAHLKLGHVPCRVLVGRTLNMSKLGLVCSVVVLDIQRELKLEELVTLVPVDLSVEAEQGAGVLLQRRSDGIQGDL